MPSLKQLQDQMRTLALKGQETVDSPTLTFAEKKSALDTIEADIAVVSEDIKGKQYLDEKSKAFTSQIGAKTADAAADPQADRKYGSLGEQFVQSKGYLGLKERGFNGKWSSGDIELKAVLTEGTLAGPGGGYAIPNAVPQLVPGIVDIRFRQLVIADLFPSGSTNSTLIRYLVETAVTNAAATVAEGGLKPASSIAFTKVDEVLHKIATLLEISDEMLEDWAQAMSYIDARLMLFVKQEEEVQLLQGDGVGTNLVGLLNRAGLAAPVVKGAGISVVGDNSMDAIYRQITAIRYTSYLEPDGIVIDPVGWEDIVLAKTAQGLYYANGPFANVDTPALWGKRVVVTPAMAVNTALVGAFAQGGQIFRKGGLTVEASNSHNDNFSHDITALRAEERLALAIYRPGAFGVVSGL